MRPLLFVSFILFFTSAVSHPQVTSNSDTSKLVFSKPDTEASFPGGEQGWRTFLGRNLNANVPVDNGAPYGQYAIIVQFTIDTDGLVSDIKALTNEGYGMEEEVMKLIHKSGLWVPAQASGKPVRSVRKQPITFMTTEYGFDIISKTPFVLFTGIDNELTIKIENIRPGILDVSISEGTITKTGVGKYLARVSKAGRVLIKVFNTKKKNEEIGTMSFEVRTPRD